MDDGLLSLKWNNHKSAFFHILSNLRKKHTYTDVTLACDGKFFPVHKLVLSTCSDYFNDIFERISCKAPIIVLKDISFMHLEALLDYMYLGEADVKQNELSGLIKAAECLRIKGLAVPDEEPAKSLKRTSVPEKRISPVAKRLRKESSNDYFNYSNKTNRSYVSNCSSTKLHSSSPLYANNPVPSQTSKPSDAESQTPQLASEGRQPVQQSSEDDQNISVEETEDTKVPVELIKVENDEEKQRISTAEFDTSPLENSDEQEPKEQIHSEEIDRGGTRQDANVDEFSEYPNHTSEIEKDEQEHLSVYNHEQLPGPSGMQSGAIIPWEGEDGSFPHLFSTSEDGQVEMLPPDAQHQTFHQSQHHQLPHSDTSHVWQHRSTIGLRFCPFCNRSFKQKVDLERHIRTHTGEKPFHCKYCAYRSTQKQTLNRHIKTIHNTNSNCSSLQLSTQLYK